MSKSAFIAGELMNRIRSCLWRAFAVVVAIASLTNSALSQGVVNFNNRSSILPEPPDRRVRDIDGVTPLRGTNIIAQLVYQDNSGAWVAHSAIAPFYSAAHLAGWWNGGGPSDSRTLVN